MSPMGPLAKHRFAAALLLSSAPAAAFAAEPKAGVTLESEIGVVSDYRFRGVSLSDEQAAVQGGITASLAGGTYGSVWASTIDEYGAGADGKGATVELDFTVGQAFALGAYEIDVAAAAYTYPGGHGVNYLEFPVSVSRSVGEWTWTVGGAYAPSQKNLGHEDNAYGYGQVAWTPGESGVTLSASAGYERGAFAPGGKWDWSAGASKAFGPVEAGVSFVGVDHDFDDNAVVASLKASF